jgi:hypothetical protein
LEVPSREGSPSERRRRRVKCLAIDRRKDFMPQFITEEGEGALYQISQKAELKFIVFLYFCSLRVNESGHPCFRLVKVPG